MNPTAQKKWNQIYRNNALPDQFPRPAQVVVDFAHLLPATGRAVELACGTGGNSLFLAERGLDCWAWDISDVALEQLAARADHARLIIHTEVRDIECESLPAEYFDVIVVAHFLDRSICEQIVTMLKPGGLLFYQTFTVDALAVGIGPKNPDYLLQPNELIRLFKQLRIHGYREDGLASDSQNSMPGQAYLVASKHTLQGNA
ncbi:MAG: class I SAM-dependent methyltransferase [Methylococcales bacterium]